MRRPALAPGTFAAVCDALADVADASEGVDRVRFLDAVDRAQNLAVASGLVHTVGQNAVQAIMAQSFKPFTGVRPPSRRHNTIRRQTARSMP